MPAYLAPGVYLRPKRTDLPDVRVVRTDVAGFIGFTERGPLPLPLADEPTKEWQPEELAVRLTSWEEFRAIFGGFIPNGFLSYAVRGFFENGGTTCHVVRVAALAAAREEQPAFARWAFAAAGVTPTFATTLASAAPVRTQTIAFAGTVQPASAMLLEIGSPTTGLISTYPIRALTAAGATLVAPLSTAFPAGSLVVGREAALLVEATSAGSWGNRVRLQIEPTQSSSDVGAFSLRVTVEPGPDREHPREEEFYREVSLDPHSPAYALNLVNARSRLVRLSVPPSAATGSGSFLRLERPRPGAPPIVLRGGQDGLRQVAAEDFGLYAPEERPRGLRALEAIDQVSILCAPDLVLEPARIVTPRAIPTAPCAAPRGTESEPPVVDETAAPEGFEGQRVAAELLAQCERRHDRVAILDPPFGARVWQLLGWRAQFLSPTSRFAATYAPWIRVPDPLQPSGQFRIVPPSGHVAGVYARTDLTEGVHRAPANAALEGVADVFEPISVPEQEELNPYGINVLRAFPGRGVRVWGARSLADRHDVPWRFIHVRRLLSMIEESVEDSMQWAPFEPNDDPLRRTVVHAISLFLQEIWQRGGLQGALPEQGFYVKCDETNNPQAVIDAGRLVCEVGVAPAAPMEFIVFEVRQKPDGAEIVEL
jgi:phage tail sheath protein FI